MNLASSLMSPAIFPAMRAPPCCAVLAMLRAILPTETTLVPTSASVPSSQASPGPAPYSNAFSLTASPCT